MPKTWREYEESLVLRGLGRAMARDVMWSGVRNNILKVVAQAAMVEDQVLDGQIAGELIFDCVSQELNAPLIITSPVSIRDSMPATLYAFRLINAVACKRIYIISPYIDDVGVEYLADSLRSAAGRGVEIRLLTREIDVHQGFRSRGLDALAKLTGSRLAVRDYHTRAQGLAHFTSVHAKLLLADEKLGYVGSAEIRGNALEKNFEMGTIIRDMAASQAAKAFEAVWQAARVT